MRINWSKWTVFYFVNVLWWGWFLITEILFIRNLIWIGFGLFPFVYTLISFVYEARKNKKVNIENE